jgi:hypothetical protein
MLGLMIPFRVFPKALMGALGIALGGWLIYEYGFLSWHGLLGAVFCATGSVQVFFQLKRLRRRLGARAGQPDDDY